MRDQVPVARSQAFGRSRAAPHGWGRERINRVGGQPEVLMSHTPIRTSIGGVGAPCVMPPPLPCARARVAPKPGSPMICDEVGVRPAVRPDAPSGNLERGRPCQACERMTCRPHGHGRVPIMCWGAVRQGQGELLRSGAAPEALILKGDWCGGVSTDTLRQRMRARRWSPWSVQRSSRRHPKAGKTGCIGVVCPLTRVG